MLGKQGKKVFIFSLFVKKAHIYTCIYTCIRLVKFYENANATENTRTFERCIVFLESSLILFFFFFFFFFLNNSRESKSC